MGTNLTDGNRLWQLWQRMGAVNCSSGWQLDTYGVAIRQLIQLILLIRSRNSAAA